MFRLGPTVSGIQPVLQAKTWDVFEVPGIVRNQGQVIDQGHESDHQVHRTDGDPLPQQLVLNHPKSFCSVFLENQYADFVEQGPNAG